MAQRILDRLHASDCHGGDISLAREHLNMTCLELAQALELTGTNARKRDYVVSLEDGSRPISGPIRVALRAMLAGYRP